MKPLFFSIVTFFCLITQAQVKINEVMVNPQNNSTAADIQSLKVCSQPTFGREYIELYNPNPCEAADISCFLIGYDNGFTGGLHGTFRFPPGTTIPPLGFLSIGGPNSGATINLQTFCGTPFLQTAADRWYLPNGDGYLILWNENGTPVDAVYWTTGAGQPNKWGTDSDIQNPPTQIANAPACPNVAALPGPSSIPAGSSFVHYAGVSPNMGLVIHRTTDGAATWATNAAPTLNACNGICAENTSFSINATVTQPSCGQSNGAITLAPSPAGTYSYNWSHDGANSSNTANNLADGGYTVTVSSGGCSIDTTIILTESFTISPTVELIQPTCDGNDGQIEISNLPPGNLTFTWSPATSTTNLAQNLIPGLYTITITDENNCEWTETVELFQPAGCGCNIDLEAVTSSLPNSSCLECNYDGPSIMINEINIYPAVGDGSIFGIGPNNPSEGEWIELYNPNWCDSIDISGYILGSYNSNGNTLIAPFRSDGMAFVIPNGTIVPPLGFVVVRGQNAPVPPVGVVDVVVSNTNNNLCIDGGLTSSRIWFQNTGGWFGFYDASGVPQDFISWGTPIAGDLNASPCIPPTNSLPVGASLASYNASGIGVNLGTASQTQTFVRMPDGGSWSTTLSTETFSYGTCNDPSNCLSETGIAFCNGQATVTPANGTAPYSFQWNDPANQTGQTALNLCAGTYDVVVTDSEGCTETFTVEVTEDLFTISAVGTNPECNQNNGSIVVTPSEPGNYEYVWSVNANISDSSTSAANNLGSGEYTVSVTTGGCSRDTSIQLVAPDPIIDAIAQINSTTCGNTNGQIIIESVSGGTAPFEYSLNNQGTSGSNQYNNLSSGSYSIQITDASGCEYDLDNLFVNSSVGIENVFYTTSPANCDLNDGSLHVTQVLQGNPEFTYNLNGTISESENFESLGSGSYTLIVTDSEGCTFTNQIIIPLTATSEEIIVPNVFTPNNDGANDVWFVNAECVEEFSCVILNRWGNLIIEMKSIDEVWDGRNGNDGDMGEGVYFYKINLRFISGVEKEYHGHITLIR